MTHRNTVLRCLAIAILTMCIVPVAAQNLNNGTCGKITNSGTIRFNKRDAVFSNAAPVSIVNNNRGIIEFVGTNSLFTGSIPLGSNISRRIGGLVLWSATEPTQFVQSRYYTNLGLSGSNKIIRDSVFVSGQYSIAPQTGLRSYTGTFSYDGTGAQAIATEHGRNSYDGLTLQNSATANQKTLSNDTATVRGVFRNTASNVGGLDVRLKGVLNLENLSNSDALMSVRGVGSVVNVIKETSRLFLDNNSTLLADDGGRLNVFSTYQPAALVINDGSSFRLLGANTGGQFHLGALSSMNVIGSYINVFASLTNAYYECSSTTRYLANPNGQILQATAQSEPNRYGKLETVGGNKIANGDVHVKCGLLVNSANRPHRITVPDGKSFIIYNDSPRLTSVQFDTSFNDCQTQSEIIGKITQIIPTTIGSALLTFNNRFTTVRFADSSNVPQNFSILSLPLTSPNNFNAASDIQRKLSMSYTAPKLGAPNWKASIQAAFRQQESLALRSRFTLAAVRTFNDPVSSAPNKIGTSYTRSLDSLCELNWVRAEDISFRGPNALISGNDFLLRSAPSTVVSVRSGRWSNPETWLDRTEPFPFDSVVVRHNVWAGFTRPVRNGWDGYSIAEAFPNAMAASVLVASEDSSDVAAAVIFGLDSTAPKNNGLFRLGSNSSFASTALGRNGFLELRNCDANGVLASTQVSDFQRFARITTSSEAQVRGLVIYSVDSRFQSTVHTNTLRNAGWIQNGATLEVGD